MKKPLKIHIPIWVYVLIATCSDNIDRHIVFEGETVVGFETVDSAIRCAKSHLKFNKKIKKITIFLKENKKIEKICVVEK